jgi:biopolymer transport protein ExbB
MVLISEFLGTIQDFIELGGPVLYAVMAVLFVMWTFIIERFWFIRFVYPMQRDQILADWDGRLDTTSWHARRVREMWISQAAVDLSRGLLMIKTCVAVCPLLGLLGTVTGMILVFDIMAIVGTGNARAMADGVSQATVPTMSGMVAALSGIYFSDKLERSYREETEHLEDLLQHH